MSRLTDTAREAVQRSQRTANLPDWWITAGGALLALVVLVLALQVIGGAGADSEPTAQSGDAGITEPLTPPAGDPVSPTNPTPTADDTATPEPTPQPSTEPTQPTGPAFTVTEGNGRGTISVPVAANDFARSALRALYSGNTDIPLAPGSKPAVALGKFSAPQLSDVTAAIDHGDSLQLFFTLDPDGPGATAQRTVSIYVAAQGDSYAAVVK